MEFEPAVVPRSGFFSALALTSVPNAQRLNLKGLIGRAQSASYVPKHGADAERLLELLHALHARYADADGCVTLIYATYVHVASRTT